MKSKATDLELVTSIMSGSRDAMSDLVVRHQSFAYTLCWKILQHREEAEEAAHDAFLKAFRSIEQYRADAKFTTWFYRIVVNTALSRKRKVTNRDVPLEDVLTRYEEGPADHATMEQKDRKMYIHAAMSRLDEIDATLVSLFYFKELSIEEISEIVKIDKSNVKVKLFRARKKLGQHLQTLLPDEHSMLL